MLLTWGPGVAVSPDSQLVYVTNSSLGPPADSPVTVFTVPPGGVPQMSGSFLLAGPSTGVAFSP